MKQINLTEDAIQMLRPGNKSQVKQMFESLDSKDESKKINMTGANFDI